MKRVVITGIGAVTPIGIGKDELWRGILAEKSHIRRATRFDPSLFRSQAVGEVEDFDASDFIDLKKLKRMDRFSQFAVISANLAAEDAGFDPGAQDSSRIGVCMGSALGGIGFAEEQYRAFWSGGLKTVDPGLALSVFCGAGSCNTAMAIGANGPVTANSNSCSSGTVAIGEAFRFIRNQDADVVFAGGSEAPLEPLCFGAFAVIRAMSCCTDEPCKVCRPFDRNRDGFVMGEGAAVLVLESLEHALKRNVRIYGEVLGYSLTNDAYHMTAPHPQGEHAARAIRLALEEAKLCPDEIEYINAHGSSTPLNDRTETLAIKNVFGDYAYTLPVSGTKAYYAHPLGASGAIEAAICSLVFEKDYIPPTLNLHEPDPECDLDYVPLKGRPREVRTILSNSFGFGGINACLVIAKYNHRMKKRSRSSL